MNFCYDWYDTQEDCLTIVLDVKKIRFNHLPYAAKELMISHTSQTDCINQLQDIIADQHQNLKSVSDMFVSLGFSKEQAMTLLNVLCSKNYSLKNRQKLLSLYEDIQLLQPFAYESGSGPLPGKCALSYETQLSQKTTEFHLHVHNLLCSREDGTQEDNSEIENLIATNLLQSQRYEITDHLIKSAGLSHTNLNLTIPSLAVHDIQPLSIENEEQDTSEQRSLLKKDKRQNHVYAKKTHGREVQLLPA